MKLSVNGIKNVKLRVKTMDDIIERQGWTDVTVKSLLIRFIETKGLTDELESFLEEIADEENAESEDEDLEDE